MKRSRIAVVVILLLLLITLLLPVVRVFQADHRDDHYPERITLHDPAEVDRLRDQLVGKDYIHTLQTLSWVEHRTDKYGSLSVRNFNNRLDYYRVAPTATEKMHALFGDWEVHTIYTPHEIDDPARVWRVPSDPLAGELLIYFEHHNVTAVEFIPADHE